MALDALLDAIERLPAFQRTVNTLPAPAARLVVGGLPGSADAALVATLARQLPTRFFLVAADGVPEAERWLADLETLLGDTPLALYPPREGFGETEPHMEIAGERVETLERLTRGELRILLTTARALAEKTRMTRALRDLRVELRKGATHRLSELADHLESIGFERVPMVDDVAQFSIRGGIFDVYSFGMAEPVRAEFWGDEIVDLRHFDLTSQRSTRAVDYALVLPVDGHVSEDAGVADRGSIASLLPPEDGVAANAGHRGRAATDLRAKRASAGESRGHARRGAANTLDAAWLRGGALSLTRFNDVPHDDQRTHVRARHRGAERGGSRPGGPARARLGPWHGRDRT